jgi:hypothetical protein
MNVLFKTPREELEFAKMPKALKDISIRFISYSNDMGIVPVVTRIMQPVLGESGVHLDNRAIDFRNEMGVGGSKLYTDAQAEELVKKIELDFPRRDGKLTIIHHAFIRHDDILTSRAPYHFHIQISPYAKSVYPPWWS